MRKIQLTEAWDEYPVDTVLQVDEITAQELISDGKAKTYVKPVDEVTKTNDGNEDIDMNALIEKAVADVLAAEKDKAKDNIKSVVDVKDLSDDDPKGGFKTAGHFCRDVAMEECGKGISPELGKWSQKTAGYAEEGQDSLGGFLVPPEFSRTLMQKSYDMGQILSRVTKFTMGSNLLKIPAVAESARADGSRQGGIQGYWKDELASKTESAPTFEMIEIKPSKLTILTYASDEILEDCVFGFETIINEMAPKEITFKVEDAIVEGNGVLKPLGFLNAGCAVGVNRSSAAVIVWLDVYTMYSRLFPGSVSNGVWLGNANIFPQLATMQDGNNNAVWLPGGNVAGAPFGTIYGRPLLFVEYCSALGTAGDLCLVDLSQYLLGTRGTLKAAQSIHLKFDSDTTTFRFVLRVDGQPWWSAALAPFKGAATTQSPFVYLTDTA